MFRRGLTPGATDSFALLKVTNLLERANLIYPIFLDRDVYFSARIVISQYAQILITVLSGRFRLSLSFDCNRKFLSTMLHDVVMV